MYLTGGGGAVCLIKLNCYFKSNILKLIEFWSYNELFNEDQYLNLEKNSQYT